MGLGFLGWAEGGYVGLQGPAFFSSSFFFLFYLKKKREGVRRRWFVWLLPRKMKGSSDDDSSSGNYDSALAMMIQAPTMTIWASAVFWFGVLFLFTLELTTLICCFFLFNFLIHQTKALVMNLWVISKWKNILHLSLLGMSICLECDKSNYNYCFE